MPFQCQANSYLKEYTTKILKCEPVDVSVTINCKKTRIKGYEVLLEDTILFPEGGGQPSDQGTINNVPVVYVMRRGNEAVHFTTEPVEVGATAKLVIDWEKRFDHMQQHSGQHLVTAMTEKLFGYQTTAWWLGEQFTYIELDTPAMGESEIKQVEDIVNEKIQEALPVTVEVYSEGDKRLEQARTRGLPKDYVGQVRIVSIQGIEGDMCCGTHVINLSHLQGVKMLHAEKGKKGKINLHFWVGGRVLSSLENCLARERKLTTLLKNGPDSHVELVEKLQKSLKTSLKNTQSLLKDIAVLEAEKFKSLSPRPLYFSLHRKEAEPDFMSLVIAEIDDQNILLFLTVGDDKGAGHMVLHGQPEVVKTLGPRVCELLGGKGAAKGSKFQAKVTALGNREKAEALIKSTLGN